MNKFLEFAKNVLEKATIPLTYQEIWAKGIELGCDIQSTGKTPWQTLGAQLFVDVRDNKSSIFIKVGKRPAKFFLRSKEQLVTKKVIQDIDVDASNIGQMTKYEYAERDLHAILTYFAYTNTQFNRGKAILTKTIPHEISKRSGINEWAHPDVVGVYIPIDDWSEEVLNLNKITNSNAITFFSFELKKRIDRGNYREYFFQAVSNSSWANEGYLVAAEISKDDELLNELERLTTSFGIGIIELDLEDIDSSRVLFHAKKRKDLDWVTVNKLSDINLIFKEFLKRVNIDFKNQIHKEYYDTVPENIEVLVNNLVRIN